jgi:hypothetical protein
MDRNVMVETVPVYVVVVHTHDLDEIRLWCLEKIPKEFQPSLTCNTKTNGEFIIRATFESDHYAALFRLFWDTGK